MNVKKNSKREMLDIRDIMLIRQISLQNKKNLVME